MSKPIDPYEALRAIDHYHLIGDDPWCEFNGAMQPIGDVCKQAVENIPPKYKHADERIAVLEAALLEAAIEIESWAEYASDYFKEKWDLKGTVAKFREIAGGESKKESPNANMP